MRSTTCAIRPAGAQSLRLHKQIAGQGVFFCAFVSLVLAVSVAGAQDDFSGDRAFKYLQTQCRFGPRDPGSEGHRKCLQWITDTCRELDLATTQQPFRARLRLTRKTERLTNVLAVLHSENPRRIMLSAHWDTRPRADRETDPAMRHMPILGANDGASGVAVLMELARSFKKNPPKVGVVFAFLDGEDAGLETGGGWCLGSKHLASYLRPEWDFEWGINLDMVGERGLVLPIEAYSQEKAPSLVRQVWEIGERLAPSVFKNQLGKSVLDDHVAFLEKGKAYINIIDIDYAYWHTLEDTEDKCSPDSLASVGRVVARFVQGLR